MRVMKGWICAVCAGWAAASWGGVLLSNAGTVYENNFQAAEVGSVPDGFLVFAGDFAVRAEGRNQFLELPGAPLDNFGALFGANTREGRRISASVRSRPRGRLAPVFGVGLNGLGGFRLLLRGNQRKLELLRGDKVVASADYRWQSRGWTRLVLDAVPLAAKAGSPPSQPGAESWRVRGKVWNTNSPEPAGWLLEYKSNSAPPRGRPSLWGQPFSGHPIHFDDLVVERAVKARAALPWHGRRRAWPAGEKLVLKVSAPLVWLLPVGRYSASFMIEKSSSKSSRP